MGMTGMEAVMEAVQDTLSTYMAAKVAALNTEYGDGITLTTIATYEWYEKNFAAQEYPAIVLDDVRSDPTERYVGAMNETHKLIIFIADTDGNAKTLKKKLYRYARAVKEILTTYYDLGGVTISAGYASTSYSPTFANEKKSRYLRTIAVEMDFEKEERA